MERIAAALDIGSNTIHLLVGRWDGARVERVVDQSELVGLAEDVYSHGQISPERLEQAVAAVADLARVAREHKAETILLVATAAVRDTGNADGLATAIRDRCGLHMRTISGEREAELTFRGASAGEDSGTLQVCDVGGGSTEVIRSEAGRVILQQSLPIGSSRLSRGFTADPPGHAEIEHAYTQAMSALATLPPWRPRRLIVTGGTATALARVAGGDAVRFEMPRDELQQLRTTFAERSSTSIGAAHQVEPKRARLLPAGAAIIAALCEVADVDRCVLTAAGLRDGLLIEYFAKGQPADG